MKVKKQRQRVSPHRGLPDKVAASGSIKKGLRGAVKSRRSVDWLLFDFDGVLTDNRVWVFEDGREAVACTRADGIGFALLRATGIKCAIISTETNPVVSRRAEKLKLPVMQGVVDKGQAILKLCRKRGIDPRRVGFVGNDVNDLPAFKVVGHRLCPGDAAPEVKSICDHVLHSHGGAGVVREIARQFDQLFG
jgi:3-deoxy-D-manno-octulosonate 8-phosphate phosphatase (KDO 8-P phosphatase)